MTTLDKIVKVVGVNFLRMSDDTLVYCYKANTNGVSKMFIVWVNYGYGNWGKYDFETLEDAVKGAAENNYGHEYIITKVVNYTIKEETENDTPQ